MRLSTHFTRFCIAMAIVILFASGSLVQAKPYWFESYQRAVQLVDAGRAEDATAALSLLIEERPTPVAAFRVPGSRFIDYLPYYQQARAHLQLGDLEAAASNLSLSDAYGTLKKSARHDEEYSELIKAVGSRTARK